MFINDFVKCLVKSREFFIYVVPFSLEKSIPVNTTISFLNNSPENAEKLRTFFRVMHVKSLAVFSKQN